MMTQGVERQLVSGFASLVEEEEVVVSLQLFSMPRRRGLGFLLPAPLVVVQEEEVAVVELVQRLVVAAAEEEEVLWMPLERSKMRLQLS